MTLARLAATTAARPGWLAGGRRLVQELTALLRDRDPRGLSAIHSQQVMLMRAARDTAAWRERAEAAEAQSCALETRLAEAELVALDLRSRLVCLQGKLAATSATQRYQTLTQALDGTTPLAVAAPGRRKDTAA